MSSGSRSGLQQSGNSRAEGVQERVGLYHRTCIRAVGCDAIEREENRLSTRGG